MFISLDPPAATRREAADWGRLAARTNRGLRPIEADAVHLTLAFLGPVPTGQTEAIAEAIERTGRPVEGVESGAPIWLPRRRPRALALELREPVGVLDALRAGLVEELGRRIGWKPDRAGFLPHLTVGRAGRDFRPSSDAIEPSPRLSFNPESITLYRSHLEPDGARYEAIYRLALDTLTG